MAEIPMIPTGFAFPAVIKNYFMVIPHVIVIVIAVVNRIASADARRTSGEKHGREKRRGQDDRSHMFRKWSHEKPPENYHAHIPDYFATEQNTDFRIGNVVVQVVYTSTERKIPKKLYGKAMNTKGTNHEK
jgi:hypothetical protein